MIWMCGQAEESQSWLTEGVYVVGFEEWHMQSFGSWGRKGILKE